jgi:hypothetical protein
MPARVEGLNKLTRALTAAGVAVDDLKDVMASIAALGARAAGTFVPRRSGALGATIRGNRAKSKAVVTAGRARVRYAGPINYGWRARNIAPARFMQRADAVVAPRAVQLLEDGVNDVINREGLGHE